MEEAKKNIIEAIELYLESDEDELLDYTGKRVEVARWDPMNRGLKHQTFRMNR